MAGKWPYDWPIPPHTTHACCVWHACEPRVNCTRVGQDTKNRIIDDGKQRKLWPFDCQSILHFVTPVTFARPGRTGSRRPRHCPFSFELCIKQSRRWKKFFFPLAVTYRRSKTPKTETSKGAGNWATRKGVDGIRQFFPLNRFFFLLQRLKANHQLYHTGPLLLLLAGPICIHHPQLFCVEPDHQTIWFVRRQKGKEEEENTHGPPTKICSRQPSRNNSLDQ